MTQPELSPEQTQALINYARRKFEEERYPLSPALRPIREIITELDPRPNVEPLPPPRAWVNSTIGRVKRRR